MSQQPREHVVRQEVGVADVDEELADKARIVGAGGGAGRAGAFSGCR